ncbi:c-type cytochrome domain-containing protein [Horticoccus sp. 23ND18S-11]|uniref:c-type cytochrome domain-containing protein n=1 Tax=Horticoccus sp. 23ND18S-11 TaxID=3391832 RepID=UPI0039C92175
MRRLALVVGVMAAAGAARAEPTFYTARVAPILERHCVVCHGAEKQKARLRLDTFEHTLRGAESGVVVRAGDVKGSELYRRITLPRTDEEAMPSDGKPELSADEIKILELWIASGASSTKSLADFPTAPVPKAAAVPVVALTADWRPRAGEIAALEKATGVRLVPRSLVATDGLVLRTASAPSRCDDAALARLAPVSAFIVEAELARTKVTDMGLKTLATWENLRRLDLTCTGVTSAGLAALAPLQRLEGINLTDTAIDDAGVSALKSLPALRRAWLFGTKSADTELVRNEVSK